MAYDPRPVEPAIYERWLEAGVFQPRAEGEPEAVVAQAAVIDAYLGSRV